MVDFSAPLKTNDFLHVGEYIASPKGLFYAIMQEDGNFCIYQGSGPSNNQGMTWALNREGGVQSLPPTGAYFALLQANGNFCICRGSGPADSLGVIWALDQGG